MGLACTTKTKHRAEMSILYKHNNRQKRLDQFYINDFDIRISQRSQGWCFAKLKPVSNVIKYEVNLYKAL